MTTYMVFPYSAEGVAPSFHCIEQADDASAAIEALKLLAGHPSAVRVTVWRERSLVFSSPSAACADWMATAGRSQADCPAIAYPEQACRPDCGRRAP